MSDYIEKRRQLWYAVLDVPAPVQPAVGKRRFVRSLKTTNRTDAANRARIVVARWKQQLAKAGKTDRLIEEAAEWREWLKNETGEPDDVAPLLMTDRAEEIERDHGTKAARLFAQVAKGAAHMIEPMADQWLEWRQYPARADYQHRRHLELLLAHHKTVEEVDRKVAGEFVAVVLMVGRKSATVNKMLSTYLQLWRWLRKRGHVEENPWTEQGPHKNRAKDEAPRRAFTEVEGRKFLDSVTGVDRDVTMVQAVTGMRVEEVCQLDPKHVQVGKGVTWLKITDAKTKSGIRRVPVVAREVRAMLARRVEAGKPLLFHELKVDRFGDRSKALVKRLGRRLRSLGFTDKALVADHSWRHRARTLLEHADIRPATADAFLGHRRPGEGLGRYSEGPSDAQLVEAARAINLP